MKNSRIFALDGARGIAAFCILLFHLLGAKYGYLSQLFIAVDFFFVLSGFVLAPAVSCVNNSSDALKFLTARFVRIFPMVFSVIAFTATYDLIVMGKHWLFKQPSTDPIVLSLPVLTISFLMLQLFYKPAILVNYPIWSLSAEWVVNLFIAACNVFTMKGKYISLAIGLLLLAVSGVIESDLINQIGRAMWGFSVGLIVFDFRDRLYEYRKLIASLLFSLVPIYFLIPILGNFQALVSVWPFSAIIIYLYNAKTSKNQSRVFAVMGKYSYGFYLWHYPMLSLIGILIEFLNLESTATYTIPLQIALCTALSIVATKVSLILFEQPLRKFWSNKAKLI
jgi:peptidoglycan/LPS O-acetylase OafA/YrhL